MNQSYSAPIPPYQPPTDATGGASASGSSGSSGSQPRYLRTEPMPSPGADRRSGFGPGVGPAFGPGFGPGFGAGVAATPGVPLVLPRKSPLLAIALAALLGPLGMLYSTFLGAFVMTGVWFWTLFLFQGAIPFVWVWGMAWALWGASRTNERRRQVEAYVGRR